MNHQVRPGFLQKMLFCMIGKKKCIESFNEFINMFTFYPQLVSSNFNFHFLKK